MARASSKSHQVSADRFQYTVIFDPDPKGGFTVTVPALPGLVTEGDTFEEAKAMVHEAILGYIESLQKHGEEIPTGSRARTAARSNRTRAGRRG